MDLTKRLDRPVVLVGLMGVGKSTVGRRLAKRLGLPFVDSDSAIEDAAGYTAAEIFERYGEQDFRDGERRLVARLIDGIDFDPQTIHGLGKLAGLGPAFLDAGTEVAKLGRTTGLTRGRVTAFEMDNVVVKYEKLLEQRRPAYAEAHIHVKSGDGAHKEVVDQILQALEEHLVRRSAA